MDLKKELGKVSLAQVGIGVGCFALTTAVGAIIRRHRNKVLEESSFDLEEAILFEDWDEEQSTEVKEELLIRYRKEYDDMKNLFKYASRYLVDESRETEYLEKTGSAEGYYKDLEYVASLKELVDNYCAEIDNECKVMTGRSVKRGRK